MTKIKLGEKELNIKFGYEATYKSGIIAKIVQLDQIEDGIEQVNAVLMLLPELILVGAQKFHEKEFGYDPNNEEQKEKQMKKCFLCWMITLIRKMQMEICCMNHC